MLKKSIFLPCGEIVCRSHSENICSGKYPFCPTTHQLPENGFTPNLMLQNMLINKFNINCDKFDESKKLLEDLNKQFREIETLRNEPEYYIDEYFRELTR